MEYFAVEYFSSSFVVMGGDNKNICNYCGKVLPIGMVSYVRHINDCAPVYDLDNGVTLEDIGAILGVLEKVRGCSTLNFFQSLSYCSLDQLKEVKTSADEFNRAIIGTMYEGDELREMLLSRDIGEFLDRNSGLSLEQVIEYRKCKEGFCGLSGEEYFFMNYCRINGNKPSYYTKERFQVYLKEADRIRNGRLVYKSRRAGIGPIMMGYIIPKFLTPEECFRSDNVGDNLEKLGNEKQ